MTIRLEMLRTAAAAKNLLPRDSSDLVVDFIRSQLNPDGGFRGRAEKSDLYYTVFALQGLRALGATVSIKDVENYLRAQQDGTALDLVHLSCLARCWANLSEELPGQQLPQKILSRIETHRSSDGGYGNATGYYGSSVSRR